MENAQIDAITDVLVSMPLACFTCGTRIHSKKVMRYLFDVYTLKADPGTVLTDLSYVRPCCRRTVMSVPISEQAIQALRDITPDEPAFNALMASAFARPDVPAPQARRVASRGRKAEDVPVPFALPTSYPYNVYATPMKGTSELVKGFRIYAPEEMEQVKAYEVERNLRDMGGRGSIVAYKEYTTPSEKTLIDDEAKALAIAATTRKAKELQYYGRQSKRAGDTRRYEELKTEYTEAKRALDGARRRYGTPAPPPPVPSTPFEDEHL